MLARGTLRKKVSKLTLALDGRVEEHQRFMLGMQLRRLDQVEVETDLPALDARIDASSHRTGSSSSGCSRFPA